MRSAILHRNPRPRRWHRLVEVDSIEKDREGGTLNSARNGVLVEVIGAYQHGFGCLAWHWDRRFAEARCEHPLDTFSGRRNCIGSRHEGSPAFTLSLIRRRPCPQ